MFKAIVAMPKQGAYRNLIGLKNGTIPWKYSADLKWFKTCTEWQTVIMGMNTYKSLGRPLINRNHVVLTRSPPSDYLQIFEDRNAKVLFMHPEPPAHYTAQIIYRAVLEDQLDKLLKPGPKYAGTQYWVCGGADIYQLLLPYCNELYVTNVPADLLDVSQIQRSLEKKEKLIYFPDHTNLFEPTEMALEVPSDLSVDLWAQVC